MTGVQTCALPIFTVWLKELGPPVPLLRDFLDERIDWTTYRRRYLASLRGRPEAQAAIAEVHALAREGRVTLLCGCADERRCHRTLLRDELTRDTKKPGG